MFLHTHYDIFICSLIRALTNPGYSSYHDYGEKITDGIDITNWNVPVPNSKSNITYSVWDFAGQTVYYNTHQVRDIIQ